MKKIDYYNLFFHVGKSQGSIFGTCAAFQSLYEMLLYEVYMNEIIDWDKIIKKEARGLDDYDLGEVQDLNEEFVVTKRGVVDKDKFYLPRSKAVKFDGDKVWFSVTKDEAKAYKHD
jgi:hypothetical protein